MASTNRKLNSKGYDASVDYSLAIKNATSAAERAQLQRERQAKINDKYNGVDPYKGTSDIMGSGKRSESSGSGGSGYSGSATSGGAVSSGRNYHQEASDAAARGDWTAVGQALAARQEKINAQGGNDRGTTNQQILDQLRTQYGAGFDALSGGRQDYVNLNAGARLPYDTGYGAAGAVYRDKGWQEGTDYLSQARRLASAGDLEGAYEALMRRGFKMADTGSTGGGTSQDQAYAEIHQLYNQTPAARAQYENEVAINRQRLQEHQTQFGLRTIPELANRQFLSTDGKYWVIYDAGGAPMATRPNNSATRRYSDQEIALMSRYYGGAENFSELDRQLHNLGVAATGVGRLVDQQGSYASGAGVQPLRAGDWTGLSQTDRYQDTDALRAILEQINAGRSYSGGAVTVPAYEPTANPAYGWGGSAGAGGNGLAGGAGPAGGGSLSGWGGDDLTAYLRRTYEEGLNAQLARLRAAYEQNAADYRAHDDLIAESYREQQNQAAAQNDLQRMYMAEMGNMQGWNTGTTGQMALAQNAAYRGSLAELMAAESRERAANDLELRKLAAGYQGDMAAAAAKSDSQLAEALYSEYVRQIRAAEEARQAAQAQANREAQLAYQRQQDAWERQKWQTQWDYGLQTDRRDSAYTRASTLLKNGVLPDSATLAAAGISQESAEELLRAYRLILGGAYS